MCLLLAGQELCCISGRMFSAGASAIIINIKKKSSLAGCFPKQNQSKLSSEPPTKTEVKLLRITLQSCVGIASSILIASHFCMCSGFHSPENDRFSVAGVTQSLSSVIPLLNLL